MSVLLTKLRCPEWEAPCHNLNPSRQDHKKEISFCFAHLESKLLEKVTAIITPLSAQLQEMQSNVTQIAQTADATVELGLTTQKPSRHLQKHSEWAFDKIIMLENRLKQHNIKLRGFPEGIEESMELYLFIVNWLATQLELEDGNMPLIDAAFRLEATTLCQQRAASRSAGEMCGSPHKTEDLGIVMLQGALAILRLQIFYTTRFVCRNLGAQMPIETSYFDLNQDPLPMVSIYLCASLIQRSTAHGR